MSPAVTAVSGYDVLAQEINVVTADQARLLQQRLDPCQGRFDGGDQLFSRRLACVACGISMPEMTPRAFSFNSPHGACPSCQGLGATWDFDFDAFTGCDLTPYRAVKPARAAAVGALSQRTLPAGLPSAAWEVTADGGPTGVTLTGPNGETVTVSRAMPVVQNDKFYAQLRQDGTTFVLVDKPAAAIAGPRCLPTNATSCSCGNALAGMRPACSVSDSFWLVMASIGTPAIR